MATALTPDQQTFIDDLRTGTASTLALWSGPGSNQKLLKDFDHFKAFLKAKGQPNPQPDDLYLVVNRQVVLALLYYADANNCLILQTCFGFDQPINQGGRVQLIQKGNLWQRPGTDDATVFNTVYKVMRKAGPTAVEKEEYELFVNMQPDPSTHPKPTDYLPVEKARQYTAFFRAYYPKHIQWYNRFTMGYLLPVKALLAALTDPATVLGSAATITFRWGLSSYNSITMGDFTLAIGTGDVSSGAAFVFRSGGIDSTTGTPGPLPCPPNPGCTFR